MVQELLNGAKSKARKGAKTPSDQLLTLREIQTPPLEKEIKSKVA